MSVSVLLHSEYGVPERVIRSSSYVLGSVTDDCVLVRVLYSPINPADLNMMEGNISNLNLIFIKQKKNLTLKFFVTKKKTYIVEKTI